MNRSMLSLTATATFLAVVPSGCERSLLHPTAEVALSVCGDGVVEGAEECDDGPDNSDLDKDGCRTSCVTACCGDGVRDSGEDCDDGNQMDGDGCTGQCLSWQWTRSDGGRATDMGNGVAVDNEGNVFVTGMETVSGEKRVLFIRKYDPHGNDVWTRHVTSGFEACGNDVAVDSMGNVLVAGNVRQGASDFRDIWIAKYDPNGDEIWAHIHDSPQGGQDEASFVVTDRDDNVIVIGHVQKSPVEEFWEYRYQTALWVRKYDPQGEVLWTHTYETEDPLWWWALGAGIDGEGNVIVLTYGLDTVYMTTYDPRYTITVSYLMLRSDGSVDYVSALDYGPGVVTLDEVGNIYSVNYVSDDCSALQKSDHQNAHLWTVSLCELEGDGGRGIAIDTDGNVLVAGFSFFPGEGDKAVVIKAGPAGEMIWTRYHSGTGEGFNAAKAIAVDEQGNVVVTGFESTHGDGLNVWVRKYMP
ncbi:SBBP repeat-containing protein [Myxococcota bacterium]